MISEFGKKKPTNSIIKNVSFSEIIILLVLIPEFVYVFCKILGITYKMYDAPRMLHVCVCYENSF